jgi:hypothetical protein
MATKNKAEKIRSIEAEADAPAVEASAKAPEEIVAEPVVAEPVVTDPVAEIVDIVSAPLAVFEEAIEEAVESASESLTASFKIDSSTFTQKSLELWSENANAFFDFVEQIARVKSFEEAVDLQSRFASERLEAFLRQSKELMESARDMASLSTAPLCGVKKAA